MPLYGHPGFMVMWLVRYFCCAQEKSRFFVGVLRFLKSQLRDFVKNLVEMLVYRTIAPSWSAKRGISQILTQVLLPKREIMFNVGVGISREG